MVIMLARAAPMILAPMTKVIQAAVAAVPLPTTPSQPRPVVAMAPVAAADGMNERLVSVIPNPR